MCGYGFYTYHITLAVGPPDRSDIILFAPGDIFDVRFSCLAGWIMTMEKLTKNESRLAEAESLILESRALFLRHYGESHEATISVGSQLAILALTRGEQARAESIKEETVRGYRLPGQGNTEHISARVSLAGTKFALGKRAEAETLISQALELGRKQWGPTDVRFHRLVKNIQGARTAVSR
jgi:hypothetical protein